MQPNISTTERASTAAAGALMLARGVRAALRRDGQQAPMMALLSSLGGSALLWRAATGYCPLYKQLASPPPGSRLAALHSTDQPARLSVIVNKPRADVYSYLQAQQAQAGERAGETLTLNIASQRWSIDLQPLGAGEQTLLSVTATPAAAAGSPLMSLLHGVTAGALAKAAATELRNIKAAIETGEVATIVGQPAGQRSVLGKAVGPVMHAARTILDEFATAPLRSGASTYTPPLRRAAPASMETSL